MAFIGEIRIFAGPFAPSGWAYCNGDLLRIDRHTHLYAVIGVRFGGDADHFRLPDLNGAVPVGSGQGHGLSDYPLGTSGGAAEVTLDQGTMARHAHAVAVSMDAPGHRPAPAPSRVLARSGGGPAYRPTGSASAVLHPETLSATGGSQPHNNMQPTLALSYIIALEGDFPPRAG